MRIQIHIALLAAVGIVAVALALAQASPSATSSKPKSEMALLKSIDKQLKRLNRNIGATQSKGARGQLADLSRDLRPLPEMRDLLQRVANNTAFEELP